MNTRLRGQEKLILESRRETLSTRRQIDNLKRGIGSLKDYIQDADTLKEQVKVSNFFFSFNLNYKPSSRRFSFTVIIQSVPRLNLNLKSPSKYTLIDLAPFLHENRKILNNKLEKEYTV
jgi:hypothetical protein